jgi:NADH:ubiquinone oxidoreductase subunit K
MIADADAQVTQYLILGVALVSFGLFGLYRLVDPIRRLIAVNLMGSGTFLVMVALARRQDPADAILHGLVVTGLGEAGLDVGDELGREKKTRGEVIGPQGGDEGEE